jgi:hypothetical protein
MERKMNKQQLLEMAQRNDVAELEIWQFFYTTEPVIHFLTINKSQYIVKNKQGEQTFFMNKTAISFMMLADFLGIVD